MDVAPVLPSCFIHVRWSTSFESMIELMKSPAKRFDPLQLAEMQMAPV
jgi:hypothetical protein